MFELPEAKRVRRGELHSPSISRSASPDPDFDAIFLQRLNQHYEVAVAPATTVDKQENEPLAPQLKTGDADAANAAQDQEDEGLEFRLFAPSRSTKSQPDGSALIPAKEVAVIRLESEDRGDRPPGFIIPDRPRSYYFREQPAPDSEEWGKLKRVAVTGADVLEWSGRAWPGMRMPWRVRMVSASAVKKTLRHGGVVTVDELGRSKKRKGKKTRIAIRKVKAKVKAKQEIEAATKQEQEMAERIKRAKRNREKKLKKREKDKAKKAASKQADTQEGDGDSSS